MPPHRAHGAGPAHITGSMTSSDTLPRILIVDDTPDHVVALHGVLKTRYRTLVANAGARALELAADAPDLILLDILMAGMDGFEVCRRLKANPATAEIPVIFLTSRSDPEDEQRGLEVGAVDYISKPFSAAVVLARIQTHLALRDATAALRDQNVVLERAVARRTHELTVSQDVAIRALASLVETRDNETGNHILRTQHYVRLLAERLRTHPRYGSSFTAESVEALFKSAPLHDIGKVGISDEILRHPGKLSPEAYEILKTHTTLGREALERAEREIGEPVGFLAYAKQIAQSHHERWDGAGYPEGLAGESIPLPARLMALADVYDALRSRRTYKDAFTAEETERIIRAGRGTQFDPAVVEAFEQECDAFRAIATRFED